MGRSCPDTWSKPRYIRPGPELPGRAGRPRGTSGTAPSHPGQLVDCGTSDPGLSRPGPLVDTGDLGPMRKTSAAHSDTTGPWTRARVARYSWSIPRALRHGPESPGTVGRPSGHSVPGWSRPGHLDNPTGTRTRTRVARESWSTPRALGHRPESPRTAGRHRRPLDTGLSDPGQLVVTACPRIQARVTQDSWSTLRGLRYTPE